MLVRCGSSHILKSFGLSITGDALRWCPGFREDPGPVGRRLRCSGSTPEITSYTDLIIPHTTNSPNRYPA